jgi:aspartyl-tRNA(Asn)/glutamyl-tRNA(Gln) amidotransferase subunit A
MSADTALEDKQGPVQVDFLLSPTAPSYPPKLSDIQKRSSVDVYMNDVLTVPASLAGLPAISVPVKAEQSHQFPAGIQLIAQYWDDRRLLALADKVVKLVTV